MMEEDAGADGEDCNSDLDVVSGEDDMVDLDDSSDV